MLVSDIPDEPDKENNHISSTGATCDPNGSPKISSSEKNLSLSLLAAQDDANRFSSNNTKQLDHAMTSEDDIENLVEALRSGALEQLRLAERLSVQLALRNAGHRVQTPTTTTPPSSEHVIPKSLAGNQELPYVSRTPFGTTKKLTLEYLQSISPRVAGPTEIIKNTKQRTGTAMTFATVGRAIEQLIDEKLVEKTDRSRWRATSKLRSVT